ncbi:DUF692 domain-containing protein [Methylocystis sp. JR02]|uniref:MNIO family bufferin maturase n=1 Tax=Methylocystis sp. JR02 TaxID=3046284 RepID=UPI0024BBD828|nr:DUF692 domain-containing protein [Methylocystis sp. JR02]MDJ0449908.1 DUF692 domain-containing protein [Methylocystis sp. JR02]
MTTPRSLGFGLGLRPIYYPDILERNPAVDWFEIISENYMVPGGRPLVILDRIRASYPIVMHGVSMSLASVDQLDFDYLTALKALATRIEPAWISDHLAWTGVDGANLHDLLPIPFTSETLRHVAERILRVQDFLGRRILVENASTYVSVDGSEMSEHEFLTELAESADCLLLLDVNNVFVSSFNHGFDPVRYIDTLPADRVQQIHLAGHSDYVTHKVDTHDHPVCGDVWELYAHARNRFGDVSSMIERDDQFPPFEELMREVEKMRGIAASVDSEKVLA